MLTGLGHGAVGGRDHQNGAVHLGSARDHVLDVIRVAGAVDVRVVALLGLVLDVGGVNRDPAGLLLRCGVDLVVGLGLATELLGEHVGDGGGQRGFAVIHVSDGADVDVRLGTIKFLFGHKCLLDGGREERGERM